MNMEIEPTTTSPSRSRSSRSSAPTTPQSFSATLTPFEPASSRVASSPPETAGGDFDNDKEEEEEEGGGDGDDVNDKDWEEPREDVMVRFCFSLLEVPFWLRCGILIFDEFDVL